MADVLNHDLFNAAIEAEAEKKTEKEPKEKKQKGEGKPDYSKWNVYKKLQHVRKVLATTPLKKTGHNDFAKYDYFQLDDFMPTATKAFEEVGLTPIFKIVTSGNYNADTGETTNLQKNAILTIYNDDEPNQKVEFGLPFVEANQSNNPIQNLGSTITYLRRYLFMTALDLSEVDIVDAGTGSSEDHSKENAQKAKEQQKEVKKPAVPTLTQEQYSEILALYDKEQIKTMSIKLEKNDLSEWSTLDAAKAINFAKGKNNVRINQ